MRPIGNSVLACISLGVSVPLMIKEDHVQLFISLVAKISTSEPECHGRRRDPSFIAHQVGGYRIASGRSY